MLRSMTGFGAGAVEHGGLVVRAEMRSVNHRFLQVKLRLPPELAEQESAFEQEIRRRVERGALTATVVVEAADGSAPLALDLALARRYCELLDQLADALGVPRDVPLERIAALPGVIAPQASRADDAELAPIARAALGRALDGLLAMREQEGAALAVELGRLLDQLEAHAASIAARMPEVVRSLHAALERRVALLLSGDTQRPVAEHDLARELALLADRADVSEELARLAIHIAQARKLVAGTGDGVGRRLDFLVQELLREANTVASKCNDAPVAQTVVEMKATLERLREQVQNVE